MLTLTLTLNLTLSLILTLTRTAACGNNFPVRRIFHYTGILFAFPFSNLGNESDRAANKQSIYHPFL